MMQKETLCKVEGCSRFARANHMCQTHNMRAWRNKDLHVAGTASGTATAFLRENINYTGRECLIWPFCRVKSGYGDVNYPGIKGQAHRVMCILKHGNPPSRKHEAAHLCGKGHEGCINPTHLQWKTPLENIHDKVLHGTQQWGEDVKHFVKLKDWEARYIRYSNEKMIKLAKMFNISYETVRNIKSGRTWKGL